MKKILRVLLILTCVLGLTACGGNVETLEYDENVIKKECDFLYSKISTGFPESDINLVFSKNDDDVEDFGNSISQIYYDTVYKEGDPRTLVVNGLTLQNGLKSWQDSKDLLGDVSPSDEALIIKAKKDELNVRYLLNGSIHDGSIDFTFDKNLHTTSITVNPKYTMGESMEKATVNTIVGMGTVFVMLIIIMYIIMLLGKVCEAINLSADKKAKKDSVDKAIEGIVAREEVVETTQEEVTDDLELIAVISAAVAAAMEADGEDSTDGFVVRSIRKVK